jgi:hypothetical protein
MKTFRIALFLSLFMSHYSYNSTHTQKNESAIKPIIIHNMDTILSPSLGYIQFRVDLSKASYARSGHLILHKDFPAAPLKSFWNQMLDPCLSQLSVKFLPVIIEYTSQDCLSNLGAFNNKTHYEAKSACENGRALYFPYQQGAIIYHSDTRIEKKSRIYKAITKKKNAIRAIVDAQLKTMTTFTPIY